MIVKFYLDTCPHCQQLGDKVYNKFNENNEYAKFNLKFLNVECSTSNSSKIAGRFAISSVPTTMLFNKKVSLSNVIGAKDGNIVDEFLKIMKK